MREAEQHTGGVPSLFAEEAGREIRVGGSDFAALSPGGNYSWGVERILEA